jgi:hypothetical protein
MINHSAAHIPDLATQLHKTNFPENEKILFGRL